MTWKFYRRFITMYRVYKQYVQQPPQCNFTPLGQWTPVKKIRAKLTLIEHDLRGENYCNVFYSKRRNVFRKRRSAIIPIFLHIFHELICNFLFFSYIARYFLVKCEYKCKHIVNKASLRIIKTLTFFSRRKDRLQPMIPLRLLFCRDV